MTVDELIGVGVLCGREIDARFPGLRSQDHFAWFDKVAWMAHQQDPRLGKKSGHGVNTAVSGDTFGILPEGAPIVSGQQPFTAVSIIRDNPPVNEWRAQPLNHGLVQGQFWIVPQPVEIGGPVDPPPGGGGGTPQDPPPPDATELFKAIVLGVQALVAGQQAQMAAQAEQTAVLKAAMVDLKDQIKSGIKIRF